jgi:hypothetical protein
MVAARAAGGKHDVLCGTANASEIFEYSKNSMRRSVYAEKVEERKESAPTFLVHFS